MIDGREEHPTQIMLDAPILVSMRHEGRVGDRTEVDIEPFSDDGAKTIGIIAASVLGATVQLGSC